MRLVFSASIVACVSLFAACGSGSGHTAGSTPAAPPIAHFADVAVTPAAAAMVDAEDNLFDPKVMKVSAGTRVTFTNTGQNIHDVATVDGGGFDISSQDFRPGASKSFTFPNPGVYRYYCSIHGTATQGMIGTIVVVP